MMLLDFGLYHILSIDNSQCFRKKSVRKELHFINTEQKGDDFL